MNKPIIAIDIDEVLYPLVPNLADYHNKNYGTTLTVEDFDTYDFNKVWGGDVPSAVDKVYAYLGRDDLHVVPIEGAKEALEELSKGYTLVVVTSRNGQLFGTKTEAWLRQHFPEVFSHVHFAGNHYDGHTFRTKSELCLEIGARLLIDDQPRYVNECAEQGIRSILFGSYGWNSDLTEHQDIVRCKNWSEVVKYVESHKHEFAI